MYYDLYHTEIVKKSHYNNKVFFRGNGETEKYVLPLS
jgi:hypothetical protein